MSQDALMDDIYIFKKYVKQLEVRNWLLGYGKGFYRRQVACVSIHQGVTILNTRFQQKTLLLFFGFFSLLRSSVSNGRPYCFCKVSFSLFFFFFLLVFSQTRGRIFMKFSG